MIIIITCLFLVGGSFFIDNFLGKKPCDLCLITRYSHLTIAFLAIASLFFTNTTLKKGLIVMLFGALCFGFYHVGVENHWWSGPAHCTTDLLPTLSTAIDGQINGIRCDVVNFAIFGISLTVYNFVALAGLFWIFSIAITIESFKKKYDI
ncbi:MAG: disulfide bond formation protein B [Holosporales bacterium]|jgi:disulfide bond formation protein DsbB|nr:disulfide bond formation protein B [Holosporales bacterium]